MTYQQAMGFALTQINERIEEIGDVARQAREDGDDERNVAARNFQNGFIECADLIDKMMMLVEMSGNKPSRTCAEAKEEMEHPLACPWPKTIVRLFDGRESLTIEELYSKLAKMGVTEAQIDGVIEMLENQPGIRFEDYVVYHSENAAMEPPNRKERQ